MRKGLTIDRAGDRKEEDSASLTSRFPIYKGRTCTGT